MHSKLAAFRIERRRISVAVFSRERLDYTGDRQLSSINSKALHTIIRYADWILSSFHPQVVAIEEIRSEAAGLRDKLIESLAAQLRDNGVLVRQINSKAMLSSFAHPPLRYRTELRQVIGAIWPILNGKDTHPARLDAAALGLYVQIETLFGSHPNH